MLLLIGAVVALVWANSPWSETYTAVSEFTFGPEALHLNLSVAQWASDGLLVLFFFAVGLELKHEFVAGELRDPRKAALPIVAAFGGVLAPALIYVLVNLGDSTALRGWAIPTATDIAFAVAVLAVLGRFLPAALRMFLLTLAVVDDLIAICIIALFYTEELLRPAGVGSGAAGVVHPAGAAAGARGGCSSPGAGYLGTDPRVGHPRHGRRCPGLRRARDAAGG